MGSTSLPYVGTLLGFGATTPTPPPTPNRDVIRNFSLGEWRRWHKPEEELKKRGLTEEAADVVAEVAARQAETDAQHRLDEQQRLDELRGEMRLRGIELESAHIKALNEERERLIHAEIAAFSAAIKLNSDNNDAIILMMMSI